ncbi:hypothetical protein [Streptomyces sp. NBRC 109706]|uniref:hypothetical protein n=1 Tax=Streptomyces sp. NBRC 109706 TaxID=1550035 RepID=UPI0007861382|nr:hypothetical protein [Streptomyces sp. NBRC 109706]
MRPARFQEFAGDSYAAAGAVQEVESWSEGTARPFGLVVTFASGARLWQAVTAQAAPGEESVERAAPEPVPLPELGAGRLRLPEVERYLVAVLANAGCAEIARVWGYTDREPPASTPGLGVEFHSGARVFAPFVHAAGRGQQRGDAYELAAEV